MIEMAPWRQRFHPSIWRYSAVDFDSTGRNFRSSEILPIKADSEQVVIVVAAATLNFPLAFQIDMSNEIFSVCQCDCREGQPVEIEFQKKNRGKQVCALEDISRRLVPGC